MRDIYHFADEVVVWLGLAEAARSADDEEDETTAMTIIDSLSLEHIADTRTFLDYAEQLDSRLHGYPWEKLNKLFQHPWFLSLWAHQEYTVALKVKALMQYHFEPFGKIAEFASRLQTALARVNWEESFNRIPWPRQLPESALDVVQRTFPRSQYHRDERHLRDTDLFLLMSLTHRCKCSGPRDRVFAVIGLTAYAGSVGDKDGQINYSQSLSEVYTQMTWLMISQSQSLQPLCFGRQYLEITKAAESDLSRRTFGSLHDEKLPSLVFDWIRSRQSFVRKQYKTSKETQLTVSIHMPSSTLQMQGLKLESVLQACLFDEIYIDRDYDQFCAIMEWLPRAKGLALWKQHFNTYPGGDDPTDAWIRTITADLIGSNSHYNRLNKEKLAKWKRIIGFDRKAVAENRHRESGYKAWISKPGHRGRSNALDLCIDHELVEKLKIIAANLEARHGDDEQTRVRINDQYSLWDQWETRVAVAEAIRRTVVGRKFFVSESGYMGFGPLALQRGDIICILQGCDVPLLIRGTGTCYHLVGECFVWGLMDGEGLKDKKETDYEVIKLM